MEEIFKGGLSAEPPHAEVKEYHKYISTIAWLERQSDNVISIDSAVEIINTRLRETLNSNYILSGINNNVENIKENLIIDLVEV